MSSELSLKELQAELARIKTENEKLKKEVQEKKEVGLKFKVSEKGALSVYGLGRFPTTLYKSQWIALLNEKERILEFINNNNSALAEKPTK